MTTHVVSLIQVFTGNKVTCMKVLAYQIQTIMSLAAIHRSDAPQFLDLLNAIVKVEELNLPLKRNQGMTLKLVTWNHASLRSTHTPS